MRKGYLRAMSFALAATMVLSTAGTGTVSLAAEVNESTVIEKMATETTQTTTEEASSEQVTTAVTTTEATTAEVTTETITEATTESVTTEAATTEEATTEEASEETLEEEELDSKLAVDSDLVSSVIKDTNLLNAVLSIYNTANPSATKTVSNFKYSDLRGFTGAMDLSTATTVTAIPDSAFEGCKFTSCTLPSSVKSIGAKAFNECKQLTTLTLPDTLSSIGKQAFATCSALASVNSRVNNSDKENTLPSGLTELKEQAFLDNLSLTQMTIPSFKDGRIMQDEPSIFAGCTSLIKVKIESSITTIPAGMFTNAGTKSGTGMDIEFATNSKVDKILGGAFSGAKLTETVDLSNCTNLSAIEGSAFEGVQQMTKVILPNKTTGTMTFGNRTFAKTGLITLGEKEKVENQKVILPDYVTGIGDGCFCSNTAIMSITLSSKLSAIPDYTFDGCKALKEVIQQQISGNCEVKVIGDCAFRSTAITNTDFMMKMNKLETIGYQTLENVSAYGNGTTENAEKMVLSIDEGGITAEMSVDNETHQKKKGNQYFGSEVFTNCTALTTVKIPASVKNIGGRAFYFVGYKDELASNITSVIWESSTDKNVVRNIYAEAFRNNEKMNKFVLPENNNSGEKLNININAFYGNTLLSKVGVASKTNNVLPASVQKIEEGAFFNCKGLTNITIQSTESKTCPVLGVKVFEGCTSLTSATIPKEITEIPRHLFYNAPLTTFHIGDDSSIKVKKIGTLAFFGNAFETVDLSKYSELEEIGAGAYAAADCVKEKEEPSKPSLVIGTGGPNLVTMIIPADLTHEAILNSAVFDSQTNFTTLKVPNGTNGKVYIPDYFVQLDAQGLFAETAVTNVEWQADSTGINQWGIIPVNIYYGCKKIDKAEDVLPKGNYVTQIGWGSFSKSEIKSADLSRYTKLEKIGYGNVVGKKYGPFESCGSLQSVKLPTTNGTKLTICENAFYEADVLKTVDLGSVVTTDKQAFASCEELENITFPDTLEKIGTSTFLDCAKLKTVGFGSLKEIGDTAFKNCGLLELTNSALPDSLEKIGANSFESAASLGVVRFGPSLKTIGSSAFKWSGVTSFDFTKAVNLEKIAGRAFSEIATLETFALKNTKVLEINDILFGCINLTKASFGNEVLYINKDALAGCKELSNFEFASTTTVSNKVFYSPYGSEKYYTANGETITINVVTPETTVVPTGRTMTLPYYINEKGFSKFDCILVGNLNSTEEVKSHLYVEANLDDGYYWKRLASDVTDNEYKITDASYYKKLESTASIKRTIGTTTKDVDVVQVKGLTETEGTIDFSITCSLSFECQKNGNTPVSVTAAKFSAKYNIAVKDVPYYADLYTNSQRTSDASYLPGKTENVQTGNGSRKYMQYWYDTNNSEPIDALPDNYDVTVITDNPAVLYPSGSYNGKAETTYETTKGTTVNDTTKAITPNKGSQTFYLIQAGVGTAHITVYPKGHPEYARTYTYVVNSDIQSIKLTVPKDFSGGAAPNSVIQLFTEYKNYLGQTVTTADMSKYSVYTNRKIVFTSSDPSYVSVDDLGNATVLKADPNDKQVKITATAPSSIPGKNPVTATVSIKVKYPDLKTNVQMQDPTSGAAITVTRTSKKDLEGEIKYMKPADTSAANVTVPDTMTLNGVVYKVTAVSASAFKGNTKIKTVKLGKYVKQIDENAFSGCKNLTKVTFSESVEKVGKKAFYNCKKLTTVTIPSKAVVKEIGESAFQNCVKLKKFTITSKVTTIGKKAFYNCKVLKTITIKSTVLSNVGANAFKNIHKKATIKVPKKKLSAYKTLLKGKGQKKTVKIKK